MSDKELAAPIGIALETENFVIVVGTPPELPPSVPEDSPLRHNCDMMGCGSVGGHILWRFRKEEYDVR